MEKQMTITQVRDAIGEVVDEVQYQNNRYIILRHGKPAAAIVPLHVYENWQSNRERLFSLIEQMQATAGDADPDEVMQLVLEAQQATRAESDER
ncbi:MAG: type II toxin-antitoxin system Phd/YefM family antitoxin [Candidatus Promineofilum sp.]|nr:type II toxin-antitoxin system Phd/YefM family antitoxin [Promineifilum sp.]